ncbi:MULTISPECIES: glycosyltransferase family 4 protein [Candidatus Nitrosocaldus]|jgi:glycosyltransferase involved in cell wall biosynthesis|uniref:Glycosyl transferase, group 1 n=1 Tax=Candidatus Nitrosocaldus cavascurensis TaxID=2058097 RepID=A0A2K5AQ53_9ARCH|nr:MULTISPECIES: glycosyltransferase family 4 protein [Candidatus Nitrosocaldus]SPC33770.1 Glycosyl transferase, group 1 [Candidatus Nitrosocaldus cavascurensis]
MKILFVTPRYHPHIGGVETHVKSIAERLVKRGYGVEVYATDPKGNLSERGEEEINGVTIRRFRSFAPNDAYYLPSRSMLTALKAADADIVHAHNIQAFPLLYACIAKREWQRLVLTTHMHTGASTRFRNMLLPLYIRIVRDLIRSRADMIICVSEFERDIVMRRLNIDSSRVMVIPNGISEDIFNVKRIVDDGFNLLSVGRLERFKNFDKVIGALHILHREYGYKDARLTIVGDGPDKDRLIKLVREFNIKDSVTFKSNLSREELLEEYARAKVFLLPSEYESYGIAAVEAIAMRIPTIVNNRSALVEFVKRGSAIGIDPPITANKVADAIVRAVDFKHDVRENNNILTWNEVVDGLEQLYSNIVESSYIKHWL